MKKNTAMIFVAVAVVLTVGILASFYWPSDPDQGNAIILPGQQEGDAPAEEGYRERNRKILVNVTVSADTVQEVTASLSRPETYRFSASATVYAGDVSRSVHSKCQVKGGLSKIDFLSQTGQVEKSAILTRSTVYLWSKNETSYYKGNAGTFQLDDLGVMPTYEKISQLPQNAILDGGYISYQEQPCIYVKVKNPLSGYEDIYYISTDFGLLVGARSYDQGELAYEMQMSDIALDGVEDDAFTLPSGAVVSE